MPDEQEFLIPLELAQGILGYLTKRPYEEVAVFVAGLTAMKQAVRAEPAKEAKGDK